MANFQPVTLTNNASVGNPIQFSDRNLIGNPATVGLYSVALPNDPYWSSVQTVLHFDGINGDTTGFVDSGPFNLTISGQGAMQYTGSSGGAAVKFGTTCLNTGSTNTPQGRYIVGSSDVFYISASTDFTIEHWFKKTSNANYNQIWTTGDVAASGIRFIFTNSPPGYYADNCAGGQSIQYLVDTGFDNAWHHLALCRKGVGGNNLTMYLDGTAVATATTNAAYSGSGPLKFGGGDGNQPATQTCIDEFRWTNAARYSGSFTPTGPFPSL